MAERPEGIPVNEIKAMRAQGISDDKIVEALQRDGYMSAQIFDAMEQANMIQTQDVREVTNDFPDIASQIQGTRSAPAGDYDSDAGFAEPSTYKEGTEEMVEKIIDDMWSELEKDVKKMIEWKNITEKRLGGLEDDMSLLKKQFDKLQQAILGKIGDYDKNLLNVGAEIKAMEKAFSNIIPEFAEAVTQLTDLVSDLKRAKRTTSRVKKKK